MLKTASEGAVVPLVAHTLEGLQTIGERLDPGTVPFQGSRANATLILLDRQEQEPIAHRIKVAPSLG